MKRILSIFIFILLCSQAYAMNVVMMSGEGTSTAGGSKTIAHVNNDNFSKNEVEGTTLAMDAKNHTTGNTIIVFAFAEASGYQTAAPTVSSMSDTASNTYTKITSVSEEYNRTYEMWYATNITGNESNVVSVVWSSAGVDYKSALSMEFSGLGTGAVDVYEEATGTGTESAVSVTNTVAATACMVVTTNTQAVYSASAGSGYTISSSVGYSTTGEFKVTSSTGTQAGNITGMTSGTWYTIQSCLK